MWHTVGLAPSLFIRLRSTRGHTCVQRTLDSSNVSKVILQQTFARIVVHTPRNVLHSSTIPRDLCPNMQNTCYARASRPFDSSIHTTLLLMKANQTLRVETKRTIIRDNLYKKIRKIYKMQPKLNTFLAYSLKFLTPPLNLLLVPHPRSNVWRDRTHPCQCRPQ